MTVGNKIKNLRDSQQMSLEELAQNAGLTVEQIQLMETADTVPSLAPLIKVARALGVRLGTFLDDSTNLGPVINRKNERHAAKSFSSQASQNNTSLDFYSQASQKAGRSMEPFLINITPNGNENAPLSTHEGEEFIYVLQGSIRIHYGKQTYVLEAGDSIYYDSIIEHLVSAATNEPTTILAVIYAPM